MDPEALKRAEDDLVAWGLVERGAQGLAWSRRFRGAVMREAARLAEEERAGRRPEGPPLANAVGGALRALDAPGAARLHEQLLLAVELAGLPESVREFVA